MKERFEGANVPLLIEAIKRQELTHGNAAMAQALVDVGELVEFAKETRIIEEGASDNDVFFIVAGSVAIVIKKGQTTQRKAGQWIGEMAAIEPAQPRSARVVAQETVVALKVSSAAFNELGERYPEIWKPVAKELSRRLLERNNLLRTPNDKPRLFIISSVEALAVAYAVKAALDPYAECIVWDKGVFFAGDFSLEALERAINNSDFAVAIAQADDVVESRDVSRPTLRDNVLFEFGLFMGRITRHRAIMIHPKIPNLKIPTDLNGLTLLPYEHTHAESELPARLTSCCAALRDIIQSRGVRTLTS